MIKLNNIYLQFGNRIIFDRVNISINDRDKIGLVGKNGAGKSTFLKILTKELLADEGDVALPSETSICYLHQDIELPLEKTVSEVAHSAFEELKNLEKQIQDINHQLGERTDYESEAYLNLVNQLTEATDRFQLLGGDKAEAEVEKVLIGLGFKPEEFNRQIKTFSGGWQMRVELAKMLLQKPDYLLLDEPTNHLDIESILWLESYLKNYPGGIIVISHDRKFLDQVTQRTVEIEMGKLYDYKAPYSKYVAMREERRSMQEAAFKNQQKVIAEKERTINRFMAKATKTKMAQSMKKQLDKMERIELDNPDIQEMNLRFPPSPRSGQVVVDAKNVVKKYGPKEVLEGVDIKIDRGDQVAFVGQNGQGKTTLARILIDDLEASGGDIKLGHNVQIGYYAQNQADSLDDNKTLLQTLEEVATEDLRPKVRSILGSFLFSGEDVEKKVTVLSGGERARLALAKMLLFPFNLLVLDEPTNHLDMTSKDVLKQALLDYDGTLIVVSHDRDFLTGLTNRTVEFRDKQLFHYFGDVNAFLEKRKLDNMRAVEMATKAKREAKEAASNGQKLDHQTRKKLMRAISSAEKKIEQIEKEIASIEKQMGEEGFYEKPDSAKTLEKYQQLKQDLEQAFEDWEEAQMELDEAEG